MDQITRRSFGALASGALAAGLGFGLSRSSALELAGITWVSDDPHLSGNFAPMGPELDAADLPVIAGRIPRICRRLHAQRTEPAVQADHLHLPVDGDGMIHAVYLDNGRARYRNRFVADAQPGRRAARRTGGLWRGDAAGAGRSRAPRPGDNPGPTRTAPSSTCIRHGGHLLALGEARTATR